MTSFVVLIRTPTFFKLLFLQTYIHLFKLDVQYLLCLLCPGDKVARRVPTYKGVKRDSIAISGVYFCSTSKTAAFQNYQNFDVLEVTFHMLEVLSIQRSRLY
jgi:hypothetical protein